MTPFDLAWTYLLKQGPPLRDYAGEDLAAIRWIPIKRQSSYAMPRPVVDTGVGSTGWWEDNVVSRYGNTVLPGYRDERIQGPITGTWVSPADATALSKPDLTTKYDYPQTLLGITESPHFFRYSNQSGYPEGFQYGGYDPEQFVRIPLPDMFGQRVTTPRQMARFAEDALQNYDSQSEAKLDWLKDMGLGEELRADRWREDRGKSMTLDDLVREGLVGVLPPLPSVDRSLPPGLPPRRVA